MHYLGELKRRTVAVEGASEPAAAPEGGDDAE